jgi:drug/metabolite transporter (DMT)-like permease
VVVALVASGWLRERLSPINLAGITLTTAAVVLTIARGSLEILLTLSVNRGGSHHPRLADAVGGLHALQPGQSLHALAPPDAGGRPRGRGGVLLPTAMLERPWRALAGASWVAFTAISYSALLGTPAHIAFYRAVRTVGPGRAAVFMNLIPFLVFGLSWLMLGEPIRWYHLVGACGVIAGVALTTRR